MINFSARRSPLALTAALWLCCLPIALHTLAHNVSLAHGIDLLFSAPDARSAPSIILHDMWLPRQCMAILSGAVLALCGWIMQRALGNPLAEPITLGITSGATLALSLAATWFPEWLFSAKTALVLTGELCALAGVFLLARRQQLAPLALILAGLLINLYCGALSLLLAIIHDRFLLSVLIWGGGSLIQKDWQTVLWLLPRLAVCLAILLGMLRQLELLRLQDGMTRSLGASPVVIRSAALLLALVMSGLVMSAVGVIGFVGLAAPHIARLTGARTSRQLVLWSPLIGAGIVWLTDLSISDITLLNGQFLPVGMMTALIGGPLLVLLVSKGNGGLAAHTPPVGDSGPAVTRRVARPAALLLLIVIALSLLLGHGLQGWHIATWQEWPALLPLRLPRMLAALGAGFLLAAAGVLMQRLSGNPLASPEVLGIGAGASLGITLFLLILPGGSFAQLLLGSTLGAAVTLLLTLHSTQRSDFNPQRVLLIGLAINALFQAVASIVMLNNPAASSMLMQLMTGSTYYITTPVALALFIVSLLLLACTPLLRRWLILLPLGSVSGSLGVPVSRARLLVLSLAALMTALATIIVGPISFVGLLGPHLARQAGAHRPLHQLFTAVLFSGVMMVAADWMGRNLLYPRQIPVGLMTTLLGGPFLIGLLLRKKRN
ncbi:iron complex transport system permease protein [Paramixta manurensis]|uniref:Iron complex transport system permease protein n=1 Tax=Paramixta manurensis TaxID=2740817 RepID=A0A6M8U8C8_9GAMM|nr:iron complex transport system permease protein [Erwiniaceae bacterium PD-1]